MTAISHSVAVNPGDLPALKTPMSVAKASFIACGLGLPLSQ